MNDQSDVGLDLERLQQLVQKVGVFHIRVAVGSAEIELVRVAHADEIRRDQATTSFEMRHDVSPQIRGGGVSVQEHDRIAVSNLDVRHPLAGNGLELLGDETRRRIICGAGDMRQQSDEGNNESASERHGGRQSGGAKRGRERERAAMCGGGAGGGRRRIGEGF
ncbi:Haloalkane dehalogenase [Gracilaria domingensis]|nr:Haloalkane dehalogenase [Gracilaria domingensis]